MSETDQWELRSDADNVRVVLRVRPMRDFETERGDGRLLDLDPDGVTVTVTVRGTRGDDADSREASSSTPKTPMSRRSTRTPGRVSRVGKEVPPMFTFSRVFGEDTTQEDMFEASGVKRMVESAVEGYAATVFAYGQTGSGKTYTITGDESSDHSHGLVPRCIEYLYEVLSRAAGSGKAFTVRASYLEIYNEQVRDLLNLNSGNLGLRWSKSRGFYVENLFVVECEDIQDLMAVLIEGMTNRVRASHAMNSESSRSHSLLTIHIDSEQDDPSDGHTAVRYGKITFVDLAGSERLDDTRSEGLTLTETGQINKSLFTLGSVISALSEERKKGSFVPYRDSKLTKLLMDSLGGNSLTLMVACCSPSTCYEDVTLSTLNYARRTKRIKNKPSVHMDPRERLIQELRRQVRALQIENAFLRGDPGSSHLLDQLKHAIGPAFHPSVAVSGSGFAALANSGRGSPLPLSPAMRVGGAAKVAEQQMAMMMIHASNGSAASVDSSSGGGGGQQQQGYVRRKSAHSLRAGLASPTPLSPIGAAAARNAAGSPTVENGAGGAGLSSPTASQTPVRRPPRSAPKSVNGSTERPGNVIGELLDTRDLLRNAVAEGRVASDEAGEARRVAEQYEQGYLNAMAENERLARRLESLELAAQQQDGAGAITGADAHHLPRIRTASGAGVLTSEQAVRERKPSLLFGGGQAASLAQMMGKRTALDTTDPSSPSTQAQAQSPSIAARSDAGTPGVPSRSGTGDSRMAQRETEELKHAHGVVLSRNAELADKVRRLESTLSSQSELPLPAAEDPAQRVTSPVVRFAGTFGDDSANSNGNNTNANGGGGGKLSSRSSSSNATAGAGLTAQERLERARKIKADRAASTARSNADSDNGGAADTQSEKSTSRKKRVRKKRVTTPKVTEGVEGS